MGEPAQLPSDVIAWEKSQSKSKGKERRGEAESQSDDEVHDESESDTEPSADEEEPDAQDETAVDDEDPEDYVLKVSQLFKLNFHATLNTFTFLFIRCGVFLKLVSNVT